MSDKSIVRKQEKIKQTLSLQKITYKKMKKKKNTFLHLCVKIWHTNGLLQLNENNKDQVTLNPSPPFFLAKE